LFSSKPIYFSTIVFLSHMISSIYSPPEFFININFECDALQYCLLFLFCAMHQRAIYQLFTPTPMVSKHPSKPPPCTVAMHFLIPHQIPRYSPCWGHGKTPMHVIPPLRIMLQGVRPFELIRVLLPASVITNSCFSHKPINSAWKNLWVGCIPGKATSTSIQIQMACVKGSISCMCIFHHGPKNCYFMEKHWVWACAGYNATLFFRSQWGHLCY
jgi:hypothetical protein